MKKTNILMVCLLAGGLLLASCGGSKTPSNNNNGNSQSQSGDNSQSGDDSQNGNNNSSTSQQENLKTLEQLQNVIGHHFHFEYYPNGSLTENSFTHTNLLKYATDGEYTASEESYDRLWINIDGKSHSYGRLVGGKYLELASPTTDVVTVAEGAAAITMLAFHDSIQYTKKETVTFLNRASTKYTLEENQGSQQSGQFYQLFTEVIIDNATGLALRHYSRQTGNMTFKTLPINFELATLNLGNDADAFIASKVDKINIWDWDTAFFTSMGLTSVTRPNEPFWYANRILGTSYDDFVENYETFFHFTGTKDEAMTKGKALVQTLYNAGLKYDEEGNMISAFDNEAIYYEDLDEGEIYFDAYTVNGNHLDLDIEYLKNVSPSYTRVDLDFYRVA